MSRRVTMFDPPVSWDKWKKKITDALRDKDSKKFGPQDAELLLYVELTFLLMEQLNLDDEKVTAAWAVLAGLRLRHPRLRQTLPAMRRAVANARQIVPYSSRFAWRDALVRYRQLPKSLRQHDFPLDHMDSYIIKVTRKGCQQYQLRTTF